MTKPAGRHVDVDGRCATCEMTKTLQRAERTRRLELDEVTTERNGWGDTAQADADALARALRHWHERGYG